MQCYLAASKKYPTNQVQYSYLNWRWQSTLLLKLVSGWMSCTAVETVTSTGEKMKVFTNEGKVQPILLFLVTADRMNYCLAAYLLNRAESFTTQ